MSLIYSTDTKQTLARLRSHLPQATLLEGLAGVGLYTIAQNIGGQSTAAVIQPTDADGAVDVGAKGVIRLSQIRELQRYTRGKSVDPRVFIINDADKMNLQSQNAFLKLLEEPGDNVHFILTSHQPHRLLQTVTSRVQRVLIPPISNLESQHFINKLGVTDAHKVQQLLFIAGGRPAEISRLIADEAYFIERATLAKDARTLVGGQLSDRVMVVARYSSDRARALQLLDAAQAVISFSILHAPSPTLVSLIDRLATTYDRVVANGNTRLQLVNFVIQ